MEIDLARFLTSDEGLALLDAVRAGRHLPPHQRRRALDGRSTPERLRAALVQDDLRRAAAPGWPEAEDLLFTREGLEQATAWPVAEERATRWPGPPDRPLTDLGAGLGADALATARTGRPVVAWEQDPVRALFLEHNAKALGVADHLEVRRGDVLEACPAGGLALLDPARRSGGRRTRDPEDFRPPASSWAALLAPFEAAMVKLPPAMEAGETAEGPFEVVSLAGRLRERRLLIGGCATGASARAALALPSGERVEGEGAAWPLPTDVEEGAWLLDPDASVTVAGLVGDLARREGLAPIHPRIAYLVGRTPVRAPGHWVQVETLLPAKAGAINRWLRERDVGRLTLRSRGLADPVETWRKRLKPRGRKAATVILTRDRHDRWVAFGGREHSDAMTEE